jgi:hypothetical protein
MQGGDPRGRIYTIEGMTQEKRFCGQVVARVNCAPFRACLGFGWVMPTNIRSRSRMHVKNCQVVRVNRLRLLNTTKRFLADVELEWSRSASAEGGSLGSNRSSTQVRVAYGLLEFPFKPGLMAPLTTRS